MLKELLTYVRTDGHADGLTKPDYDSS